MCAIAGTKRLLSKGICMARKGVSAGGAGRLQGVLIGAGTKP